MSQFSEYASFAGMLMGLAAILPKLLAVITRRRQVDVQSEISRFEVIMRAQDSQIKDCEEDVKDCRGELQKERADRVREREYFFRQVTAVSAKVHECEGIMRRMGWKEQRKQPRNGTTNGY